MTFRKAILGLVGVACLSGFAATASAGSFGFGFSYDSGRRYYDRDCYRYPRRDYVRYDYDYDYCEPAYYAPARRVVYRDYYRPAYRTTYVTHRTYRPSYYRTYSSRSYRSHGYYDRGRSFGARVYYRR